MTTPSESPPPSDPEESADLPPPAESAGEPPATGAPTADQPAPAAPPSPESQADPVAEPAYPAASESPAPSPAPAAAASGSSSKGPFRFFAAHKVATLAVGGGVAVVVVAIVVLLATGVLGGGGGGGGGGSAASGVQAYIIDDSDGMFLEIVNVAGILAAPEIPARLESDRLDSPSTDDYDDPEEWKDEWRDSDWSNDFPVPSWFFEYIELDDLTTVFIQNVDGTTGYGLVGNFPFADLRDLMEDEEWEEDTYREFEVWNDRDVALLEDKGVILLGDDYVSAVLKGLDTGRGLVDGESTVTRVLNKAGSGLHVWAGAEDCQSFASLELRGCQGFSMTITGGDVDTTLVSTAFLFSSERRAESSLDDIEESVLDSDDIDADIEEIGAEGEFITYKLTIHE